LPVIVIDPGHGGQEVGAVHGQHREKVFNLIIADKTARFLNANYDAAVHLTRIGDITMGLNERAIYANQLQARLFVSLHVNAGGGTGFESYIYTHAGSTTQQYREIIHDWLAGFYKERGIVDRGKKKANFAVLRKTAMSAVLLENLFIDQETDLSWLLNNDFLSALGTAIGQGVARALQLDDKKPGGGSVPVRVPVTTQPDRARQFLQAQNPAAPDFINIYVEMGQLYRIRWDAVFAQSCKETLYWKFGGSVKPEQNNFGGLGTFDGKQRASFKTPREGIEAQFQHWHAYCHGGELPPGRPELDPRRRAVLAAGWGGTVNFVEDLGGKWAPSPDYGVSIVRDFMARFVDEVMPATGPGSGPTPPPQEPAPSPQLPGPTPPPQEPVQPPPHSVPEWNPAAEIQRLREAGLIVDDHPPDANVTWGEFATVINRLRDKYNLKG